MLNWRLPTESFTYYELVVNKKEKYILNHKNKK